MIAEIVQTTAFSSTWFSSVALWSIACRLLYKPSYSLRRKGHCWGPPQKSSSHVMLSGRKCNLYYSTSVQQQTVTVGHLWVQLCQWCRPYLEDGQSFLWDQHLALELWWAGSLWPRLKRSARSPGLRLPSEDTKWARNFESQVIFVWYIHGIHGIYQVYTLYIMSYSKTCFLGTIELLSCNNTLWTCISSSSNIHRFFKCLNNS